VGALAELICGDEPAAWERLGFALQEGATVRLGTVRVRLDGGGGGLRGWTLRGEDGAASVAGVPTRWSGDATGDEVPRMAHPNGATSVDHVVLLTNSRDRTCGELVGAGGDERRRAEPPSVPVPMAFVRMGDVIVEVAEAGGAPRLWGLAVAVDDLDASAALLGGALGAVRPAVQPGRMIATVRREAGLGAALAFMSPR
jgi:hypothetical protein